MKNIQARILLLSMSLIMLTSCGPAQSEYDEQEARIKILERQLEECKNGAQKRIAYIRDLFENKKYSEVIISSKTLLSRFPGTQEAKEAQILANKSSEIIVMEREEKAKFQAVERKKQEERTKVALKNIVIKNDEMQRLKFYQHKDSPNYINSKSTLLPYFLVDDRGNAFLRLKNIYVSSDWLFIESYKIKADDKFFDIEVSYNDINHDNDSGEIWEWIDTLVSEDDLLMLKAIADSKGSKIRYIGKQYYKDREISEVEKKIIREVLLAFDEINKSLTGENK